MTANTRFTWTDQQKDIVNYSTIPMTEFVNDIVEAHQEDINKIKEELAELTITLRHRENKLYEDVSNSVKKEFPIFSFLHGNTDEGKFMIELANNRKAS